ncbi:type VII secretion protein EccB [Nocardioides sp. R-C-SC26]|uniref:type VII secretion protein EccB n=1 Tax=Nocardioides sp. R-C-SC26 TaxID=2870414 RepID=UPI001E50CA46|nr:type VII secretion protein EccB [Nocardioides sp. R-C-SC26]
MATKKDLVEAYSFSRRRLVTAFLSGAPGGREVEPSRPGRAIIGGIALAVLLVAGAAVLRVLKSPIEIDWDTEMLVSEKESGADYVYIAPLDSDDLELRPVANITSAMLLLGSDVQPTVVPHDEIARKNRGEGIGILQAPETPPASADLLQSGWTACTGRSGATSLGIRASVTSAPDVRTLDGVNFVVRSEADELFLIAVSPVGAASGPRAYSYAVPEGRTADGILQAVAGTSVDTAVPVPDEWLELFPAGAPLTLSSFGLRSADLGSPSDVSGQPGMPDRVRVGDTITVDSATYLVRADDILALDSFAAEVYLNLDFPRGRQPEPRAAQARPPGTIVDGSQLPGAFWPVDVATDVDQPDELCAQLLTGESAEPRVVLGTPTPGSAASAVDVPAGPPVPVVESGHGAFVLAGDWDVVGPASRTLIDDRGFAYPVSSAVEQDRLGYATVPPVVVPDAWIELFSDGVPLSVDAARCPPTSEAKAKPCG